MPSDPATLTISELVRHAGAIVDPDGDDEAVVEFVTRYEDDDKPVRGLLGSLAEHIAWGADENPAVIMAQAVVLYLGHRPGELHDDPVRVLRLAARAELDGRPPQPVAEWLSEVGVSLD
jgi:hypothetical protein